MVGVGGAHRQTPLSGLSTQRLGEFGARMTVPVPVEVSGRSAENRLEGLELPLQLTQRRLAPIRAARLPLGPASFGTYGPSAEIVGGQWALQRAGGDAGVCANWTSYPDTGWVGVILANRDDVPLTEMIGREMQAVTGAEPGDGGGG